MNADRRNVREVNRCLPYRRLKSSRIAAPTCSSWIGERFIQLDIAALAGPEAFLSKNAKKAYVTTAYMNGVVKPKSFSASVSTCLMRSPANASYPHGLGLSSTGLTL